MNVYKSKFADDILAMLDYHEALGYSRYSHEKILYKFDAFCAETFPQSTELTEKIVISWLESEEKNIATKASSIRFLGKYMLAIDKKAYVLYEKYASSKLTSKPYIFTDEELKKLFNSIDTVKNTKEEPFLSEILSVIFRLIYTCGLRPNEGRELKCENINFKTGEILITNTKGKKDRLVVMSNDMLNLCKDYSSRRGIFAKDSEYFFPSWKGGTFTNNQVDKFIKSCFKKAYPYIQDELPNIRVYDLRHRYASAVLNRWLDNKDNIASKLSYLRAYMGHNSLSETAYYIHLLPENLLKSSGVDWKAFEEILPEVSLWEE